MARLQVLNVKKVESQIKQDIRKALRSKELRDGVGEVVVNQIRQEKVPVTSKKTKKMREYFEKANSTHPDYERSYINITFTGELLSDLIKNVKAAFTGGKSEYVIEHSDKLHKKYLKPSGKPTKGSRVKYEKLQEYLREKGYDYLTLSEINIKRVTEFVKEKLFDMLKKRK
jgi:hypothetical protein